MDVPEDVLGAIREAAGPGGWIDDAAAMEPYLIEERGLYRGTCAAVVRPDSTESLGGREKGRYKSSVGEFECHSFIA